MWFINQNNKVYTIAGSNLNLDIDQSPLDIIGLLSPNKMAFGTHRDGGEDIVLTLIPMHKKMTFLFPALFHSTAPSSPDTVYVCSTVWKNEKLDHFCNHNAANYSKYYWNVTSFLFWGGKLALTISTNVSPTHKPDIISLFPFTTRAQVFHELSNAFPFLKCCFPVTELAEYAFVSEPWIKDGFLSLTHYLSGQYTTFTWLTGKLMLAAHNRQTYDICIYLHI